MDTSCKILFVVLLFGFTFIWLGCPKECVSPERTYLAEFTFDHKYDIQNIQLGDTIWISARMDCNNMYNTLSSSFEPFCDNNFSFPMRLVQFVSTDTIKKSEGAVEKFDYLNFIGEIYNSPDIPAPEYVNQVRFGNQGTSYEVKIAIICLEKGNYYFALSPGGTYGGNHCNRAGLVNSISNQERGQEQYIDFRFPDEVTERDLRNIYCFEVR